MIKLNITFRAYGVGFSPAVVARQTGVPFSRSNEPGSIGVIGRYRDQSVPYGSAELVCPEVCADLIIPDAWFFPALKRITPACLAAGATEVVLHVDVAFTDQCNLEMSSGFASSIADLGITLTMTCYDDSPM